MATDADAPTEPEPYVDFAVFDTASGRKVRDGNDRRNRIGLYADPNKHPHWVVVEGAFAQGTIWNEGNPVPGPPPAPLPPDADQVRAECARRLCLIFGARDREHLAQLINEATMEAVELTDLAATGAVLTEDQQARAAYLRQARALVKAHDAASKALRDIDPIPADFSSDEHWP